MEAPYEGEERVVGTCGVLYPGRAGLGAEAFLFCCSAENGDGCVEGCSVWLSSSIYANLRTSRQRKRTCQSPATHNRLWIAYWSTIHSAYLRFIALANLRPGPTLLSAGQFC